MMPFQSLLSSECTARLPFYREGGGVVEPGKDADSDAGADGDDMLEEEGNDAETEKVWIANMRRQVADK